MNKEVIQDLIGDKFQKIDFLPDRNILRAEYRTEKNPIGIYYVDYNDDNVDIDLREYQESLLVNDYYNNTGPLQWNYYLIFLRERYSQTVKVDIEKNDIYSRKFLFNPTEFKEYLQYRKSSKIIEKDITLHWKEKLDEVQLYEVYSNSEYTKAIDRFINNEFHERKHETVPEGLDKGDLEKISSIDCLELKANYRKYPVQRKFDFGKVNLISGVNGVGKTSLLESIELVICGDSLRNLGKKEKNQSIEAFYNKSAATDLYTPSVLEKYRERDRKWYQNDYRTKNYLCWSFNKYNFYNADAAYKIHNDSKDDSIVKYLTRIAIGSEFGRIRDRLKGFLDRLKPVLKGYLQEVKNCEDQIKRAEEVLKSSPNSDANNSIQTFSQTSGEYLWLKPTPSTIDSDLSIVEKDIIEAENIANRLNQLLPTSFLKSQLQWEEEKKKLNEAENRLQHLLKEHEEKLKQIQTLKDGLGNSEKQLNSLKKAEKYYSTSDVHKILGLNHKIDELAVRIDKYESILRSYQNIDQTIFNDKGKSISEYRRQISNDLSIDIVLKNSLESEIRLIKGKIGEIQQVLIEIKSGGKRFLELNPESKNCPLCETSFDQRDDLYERINRAVDDIFETVKVGRLDNDLIQVNSRIKALDRINKQIDLLNSIAIQYYEIDASKYLLEKVFLDLDALKTIISTNSSELSNLKNLKEILNKNGIFENEYTETIAGFTDLFGESFDYRNKKAYDEMLATVNDEYEKRKGEIEKQLESLAKLESDLKQLIKKDNFNKQLADGFISETNQKLGIIDDALKLFNSLRNYLKFDSKEEISSLYLKIENLHSLIVGLKNIKRSLSQLNLSREIVSKSTKIIEELTPEITRIKKATDVLETILENDTEEKVLADFIEENNKEIKEVFLNIHSPQEFSDIFLDGQELFLRKSDETLPRSISMISSGQRSALALSIFLTLNKKLNNGPEIIMFDDPVTFTDDLNILSFLDYLRELVLNENRQVFFSTANKRLAGLFEKKFSFLNDGEFKRYELIR